MSPLLFFRPCFQWFQVPAELGLGFSLMSASFYDAAGGKKETPHFPKA